MENTLRARRAALGKSFTQERVAKKVGFDHTKLSRIENGLIDPTRDEIKALAKALKTTPAELFPGLADQQQNAGAR